MSIVDIKFGDGWAAFSHMLDPKFVQKTLEKHVGRATGRIAALGKKRVREYIRQGVPTTSGVTGVSELTSMLKRGEERPIVGTRGLDLFNSIIGKTDSWDTAIIGSYRHSGSHNVSKIVHDGATIPVTAKMRNMFFLLSLVDRGKMDQGKLTGRAAELYRLAGKKRPRSQWFRPIKPETRAIVIPPRPFLRKPVIEDSSFRAEIQEIWTNAVRDAMREQASKGTGV